MVFAFVKLPIEDQIQHSLPKGVSIVICARNEANHLKKNLPAWLNQKGIPFEIIIVNDGSTDGSDTWLVNQAVSSDLLRVIHISNSDKESPGKKQALSRGIAEAKYPHLLLTDADCCPIHSDWASLMTNQLTRGTDLVIGFSPLTPENSLASIIAASESILTAMQYGSYTAIGRPYMGVGRNIAYTRTLFEALGGFRDHVDVISGDDDLFVQQAISKKANISLCLHPDSLTSSSAPATLKDYFAQKSRHISTSTKYPWSSKVFLGWFALSHGLFYIGLILGLFAGMYAVVGFVLAVRLTLIGIAWKRWMNILLPGMNWMYYVCFDLWLVLYYIVMAGSLFRPSKKW